MARRPVVLVALAVALFGSVLLGGCAAVGPNYTRPQLPTPPQYRFVDGPAEAESLADLPWFQVFKDGSLQTLIRDAIANNLDLRSAVARVDRLRAQAGIVKSFLCPHVDGS